MPRGRYHDESAEYTARRNMLGEVVSWIFIVEMFFKLLGLGCGLYWSDVWNKLDGTLVSISIGEILMNAILGDNAPAGIAPVLRMLRMLRIVRALRLIRKWKAMMDLVSSFVKAIPQVGNLILLMTVVMFIFAIVGMQVSTHLAISLTRPPTRPLTRSHQISRSFLRPSPTFSPVLTRRVLHSDHGRLGNGGGLPPTL